jgi:hypothetical protein
VTPFDTWYSSVIAPMFEEILKSYPASAREQMRKASRESMAACWNACTVQAQGKIAEWFRGADNPVSGQACALFIGEQLKVKIS